MSCRNGLPERSLSASRPESRRSAVSRSVMSQAQQSESRNRSLLSTVLGKFSKFEDDEETKEAERLRVESQKATVETEKLKIESQKMTVETERLKIEQQGMETRLSLEKQQATLAAARQETELKLAEARLKLEEKREAREDARLEFERQKFNQKAQLVQQWLNEGKSVQDIKDLLGVLGL